tara:strand:- start:270 stop:590 length:321 start_codon:yes stop_codon:yes gene_type:complete
MNKLEKLDDTKNNSWWKWLLVILAALGSVLFLFLGDKRSAKLLVQRKKEIHKGQKDAKIDLAVGSREAVRNSQESLKKVQKEIEDKVVATNHLTDDEVFDQWDSRS